MEASIMMDSELVLSRIVEVFRAVEEEEEQVHKLPMGYRFLPSDVQLINSYLIPKVSGHLLPADVISSSVNDVLRTNPWDLPGDSREKRYFFCKREKKVNIYVLVTDSGYWKAPKKDQVIFDTSGKAIALKRKLTFFYKIRNSTTDDRWVMWEYRLLTSTYKNEREEIGDWMVCAIISERKKNNVTFETDNVGDGDVIDYSDNGPCYKRCRYNDNIVSIIKNYETMLASQESSTSSNSSTLTITNDEDIFSQGEASSNTCLD